MIMQNTIGSTTSPRQIVIGVLIMLMGISYRLYGGKLREMVYY